MVEGEGVRAKEESVRGNVCGLRRKVWWLRGRCKC